MKLKYQCKFNYKFFLNNTTYFNFMIGYNDGKLNIGLPIKLSFLE
jgi:hypothetical protein